MYRVYKRHVQTVQATCTIRICHICCFKQPFLLMLLDIELLDIELRGVDESCTESILDDFVGRVDAEFSEDVLAMGGDGMDA